MALVVSQAASLDPRARLDLSIKAFESALEDDAKIKFAALKGQQPPSSNNVIALAAEIGRLGDHARAQQMAPRLTKVLAGIRTFTSLADLVVGGSQNIIVGSVWGVVKVALESATRSIDFFEKLSDLFMVAGRFCPDLTEYLDLYPNAEGLQHSIFEYLTCVVDLCKDIVTFVRKPQLIQKLKSAFCPFDATFGRYRTRLEDLGKLIDRQITKSEHAAQATERQESAVMRKLQSRFSTEIATELRLLRAEQQRRSKVKLQNKCTKYNSYYAWRHKRKSGNTKWILQNAQYQQWKSTGPAVLVCHGSLGCGKSVIAANVVEDIMITKRPQDIVCYHFCRFDLPETNSDRSILGSLVRQILDTISPEKIRLDSHKVSIYDSDDLMDVLRQYLPLINGNIFFILDGLSTSAVKIFHHIVSNIDSVTSWRLFATELSRPVYTNTEHSPILTLTVNIDESRPRTDLEEYAISYLSDALEDGSLQLSDPMTINTVVEGLLAKAGGMFLWLSFQLRAICESHSDSAMIECLSRLPKDLATTYERILKKITLSVPNLRTTINHMFQIMAVSKRNLTEGELSEALSIQPGMTKWEQSWLANIHHLVQVADGLVVADEELQTLQFVHGSVLDHLLECSGQLSVDENQANRLLGGICVTYLHMDNLDRKVSKAKSESAITGQDLVEHVVKDVASHAGRRWANKVAIGILKHRRERSTDLGKVFHVVQNDMHKANNLRHFKSYASEFHSHHAVSFVDANNYPWRVVAATDILRLYGALLLPPAEEGVDLENLPWRLGQEPLNAIQWIVVSSVAAVFYTSTVEKNKLVYLGLLAIIDIAMSNEDPRLFSEIMFDFVEYESWGDSTPSEWLTDVLSDAFRRLTHAGVTAVRRDSYAMTLTLIWCSVRDGFFMGRRRVLCLSLDGQGLWLHASCKSHDGTKMVSFQGPGEYKPDILAETFKRYSSQGILRIASGFLTLWPSARAEFKTPRENAWLVSLDIFDPGIMLILKGCGLDHPNHRGLLSMIKYEMTRETGAGLWPQFEVLYGTPDDSKEVPRIFFWARAAIFHHDMEHGRGENVKSIDMVSLRRLDTDHVLDDVSDRFGWKLSDYALLCGFKLSKDPNAYLLPIWASTRTIVPEARKPSTETAETTEELAGPMNAWYYPDSDEDED